ncbi:hypothetical protein CHUAL_005108 [Chamberlinius hualienensis]
MKLVHVLLITVVVANALAIRKRDEEMLNRNVRIGIFRKGPFSRPTCASTTCPIGTTCIERPRGATCRLDPTQVVPTCASTTCPVGATCVERPSGATCRLNPTQVVPTCASTTCPVGATCIERPSGATCRLNPTREVLTSEPEIVTD